MNVNDKVNICLQNVAKFPTTKKRQQKLRSLRSKSARGRPCKSPKFQGFHQPNPRKPIFRSAALYHLFDSFRKRKSGQIYNLGKGFSEILEIPSQLITISGKTKSKWDKISYFPTCVVLFYQNFVDHFISAISDISDLELTLTILDGLYPTSCRYFWWYLPPTWQAGPVNQRCDIFFGGSRHFFGGGDTPQIPGEKF